MPRPRVGIRARLLLVSTLLLAIPYVGYRYVQEMEAFLREGQEEALLGAARALAGALHDRPDLFPDRGTGAGRRPDEVYAHPLRHPIQVDGYADDWHGLLRHLRALGTGETNASIDARYLVGKHGGYLYVLVRVDDDHIVFRPPSAVRADVGDHVRLTVAGRDGRVRAYALSTPSPGWVPVHETLGRGAWRLEGRIRAEWQRRTHGYTVEARVPMALVGRALAIAVADADDPDNPRARAFAATARGEPGPLILPSAAIEGLIQSLGRTPGRRIWVVDAAARVLARGGSLETDTQAPAVNPLFALLLPPPSTEVFADQPVPAILRSPEVEAALAGTPASHWRAHPDAGTYVVTATHPVLGRGGVAGAVVVEETSLGIQTVRRRALAELFNRTLVAFGAGAAVLLLFATRLSTRLRRLRDQTEHAIDPHGRVVGALEPTRAGDEVGDLTRSFAAMMERLRQYNHYLEQLARRLSHELRTPIAVVRSSLDALEPQTSAEESRRYLRRARDGLTRLETIITRMSEAARLEQALEAAERERFDLDAVIRASVDAYRSTWSERAFDYTGPGHPVPVDGVPDLIVQALDKTVANARDFGAPEAPIEISLSMAGRRAVLAVSNRGSTLPETMRATLFDSMVSVRSGADPREPHLGLGLYIVRLVAEYHGGSASAENRSEGDGVTVVVSLPIASP